MYIKINFSHERTNSQIRKQQIQIAFVRKRICLLLNWNCYIIITNNTLLFIIII